MGATEVFEYGHGKTMQIAFEKVQREAEEEYGNDSYNGKINNCFLVADWTNKYNGKNLNELADLADDYCGKGEVIGICIDKPVPNKNKTKSQVENKAQKGARKWVTVYLAINIDGDIICQGKTQAECVKKARKYVEDRGEGSLNISIAKQIESGNSLCAKVSYKASSKEKQGRYVFLGLART